jgi:hypothetical protein
MIIFLARGQNFEYGKKSKKKKIHVACRFVCVCSYGEGFA